MTRTIAGLVIGLFLGATAPTMAFEDPHPCTTSVTYEPRNLKQRITLLERRVRFIEDCLLG